MPPLDSDSRAVVVSIAKGDPISQDIRDALRRAGFEDRPYQRTAILSALVLLLKGRNAEINLPPGTGKTIISQVIGVMWSRLLRERERGKVLFLVPSTVLLEQHFEVCLLWTLQEQICHELAPLGGMGGRKRQNHWAACAARDLWFSLPGRFAGAVNRGYVPREALAQVGLVVVDEYDSFSVSLLRAEYGDLRFAADFQEAVDLLARTDRRYLFLSATGAQSPDVDAG